MMIRRNVGVMVSVLFPSMHVREYVLFMARNEIDILEYMPVILKEQTSFVLISLYNNKS
jgi:hypothetical protein